MRELQMEDLIAKAKDYRRHISWINSQNEMPPNRKSGLDCISTAGFILDRIIKEHEDLMYGELHRLLGMAEGLLWGEGMIVTKDLDTDKVERDES